MESGADQKGLELRSSGCALEVDGELLNFEQGRSTIRFAIWLWWGESVGIVLIRVGESKDKDGE